MGQIPENSSEFIGHVDHAYIASAQTGESRLVLEGWVTHLSKKITSIGISIPESSAITPAVMVIRQDVIAKLPHLAHASDGGFQASIPLSSTFSETNILLTLHLILEGGENAICKITTEIKGEGATSSTPYEHYFEATYGSEESTQTLDTFYKLQYESFLRSRGRLLFDSFESPQLSVILVSYNNPHLTYSCIRALLEQQNCGLEVIIVDNGSSEETLELLARIHGVRILYNSSNLHFIDAANQGATFAKGEYILFVNNDAVILPGCLFSALSVFRNESRVGAVGGKLIRADGKLQEAGSAIFSDGSTEGRFRGFDPYAKEVSTRQEVDYCSGAFLMTPRELFLSLRMFDTAYKPAYYEDVDYCVRLREYGYKVFYEPGVGVLHVHHAGSDSHQSAAQAILANRPLFAKRHAEFLSQLSSPSEKKVDSFTPLPRSEFKLLFIDDFIPDLTKGQGQPRTFRILEALSRKSIPVTLVGVNHALGDSIPSRESLPQSVRSVDSFSRDKLEEYLEDNLDNFTHLFVSRPMNMEPIQRLRQKRPQLFRDLRIIYDAEAIFAIRDILKTQVTQNTTFTPKDIRSIVKIEAALAKEADVTVAVSDGEMIRFSEVGLNRIYKLGHLVYPTNTVKPFNERKGIMTLGPMLSLDSPNSDGVKWFIDAVIPLLSQQVLSEKIYIGGNVSQTILTEFSSPHIELLGILEKPQSLYDKSRLFIAPQRYGAGIPLKVIEAAAAGIPCVVSSLIADQLGWRDGVEYLVGRTPEDFARHIQTLSTDKSAWEKISERALARVTRDYSEKVFDDSLELILTNC